MYKRYSLTLWEQYKRTHSNSLLTSDGELKTPEAFSDPITTNVTANNAPTVRQQCEGVSAQEHRKQQGLPDYNNARNSTAISAKYSLYHIKCS